jgi:hypothetical protein
MKGAPLTRRGRRGTRRVMEKIMTRRKVILGIFRASFSSLKFYCSI